MGFDDVLDPARADMIVKEASYETSEPTVNSQVVDASRFRRERLHHCSDAEIRRPGDPKIV